LENLETVNVVVQARYVV